MGKMSLKDEVYNGIYNDIINGKYKHEDILTERMLINQYDVSKSPVREALVELTKEGILTSMPRVGYRIVPVTVKEIIDILDLRVCIEVSGLKKAYETITDKDIENLQNMYLEHRSERDNIISNNWSRNNEFHTYLYSLNGNSYGYKILIQIIRQSSLYIAQYFQIAWDKESESDGKYHNAVIEALKKRDMDIACNMLTKDILAVKEEIQNLHMFG